MIPVSDALERLLAASPAAPVVQTVPLKQALGRVLAQTLTSNVSVPPTDNSAVDGYAIRFADLQDGALSLPVSQRVPAGAEPAPLAQQSAGRIFTGAAVPAGADTVLMQEDCSAGDGEVLLPAARDVKAGANIRRRGQDIREGEPVVPSGTLLSARHLGLLASVGLAQLPVYQRLTVAVLSTGDELAEPGEPAGPTQIYNSNRYLLDGLLRQAGFECLDLGRVADDREQTAEALRRAAEQADLVLTTGGVSVGEEDHVRAVVEQLGALDMWRLAIKPGKPFAFGRVGETPFMGLPGNPSAVLVTFLILVLPWLRRAQGLAGEPCLPTQQLPLGFSVSRPGKREEYLRVRVVERDGQMMLEKHPNQSSGMLSSACWADGLAVIPQGKGLKEGDLARFIRFP